MPDQQGENRDDEKQALHTTLQPYVPGPDALPADIRIFLTKVLCSSRGLPLPRANSISNRWTIGTGRELRNYPPKIYLEIFGVEDGWCVYKEVKTRLLVQTHPGPTSRGDRVLGVAICLLCAVLAFASVSVMRSSSKSLSLRAVAIMLFPLFVCGGLAFWRAAVAKSLTVDETIEKELRDLFAKDNANTRRAVVSIGQ